MDLHAKEQALRENGNHTELANSGLPHSILLTGGASCGKSSYAEALATYGEGRRIYIATMPAIDAEGERRIRRHRKLREGKGFETIECYSSLECVDLGSDKPESTSVLLECMTNHISNLLFEERLSEQEIVDVAIAGIENLQRQCGRLIIITNEVGCGTGEFSDITECYIRVLGQVNSALAESLEVVAEVVCGIPVFLKGEKGLECLPDNRKQQGESGMILIVGGEGSGKRTFAESLGFAQDDMSEDPNDDKPVVYNVQDVIAKRVDDELASAENVAQLKDGKDITIAEELVERLSSKQAVICNEVGSGIVPISLCERIIREQVGKFCSIAAGSADVVVRMVCGIPTYLKGNPEGFGGLSK